MCYIWFDKKMAPGSLKVAPGSYKIPVKWLPVLNLLFFPLYTATQSLEQGISNFFPGDANFSIKRLRDPKQKKTTSGLEQTSNLLNSSKVFELYMFKGRWYILTVLSNPCMLLQAPQHGYVIIFVGKHMSCYSWFMFMGPNHSRPCMLFLWWP